MLTLNITDLDSLKNTLYQITFLETTENEQLNTLKYRF